MKTVFVFFPIFLISMIGFVSRGRSECLVSKTHESLTARHVLVKDSVYLFNISRSSFSYFYFDHFDNLIPFTVRPGSSYVFYCDSPTFVVQSAKQIYNLIQPGDSIFIESDAEENDILFAKGDTVRTTELKFYRELNKVTPFGFFRLLKMRDKYINTEYKTLDSIYRAEYAFNTDFLASFIQSNKVSDVFVKYLQSYFVSHFYASQLFFIGTEAHAKIDTAYQNYLFNLKSKIFSGPEYTGNFWFSKLQFVYAKYIMKSEKGTDWYYDSLYTFLKKNCTSENTYPLFLVLKEGIKDNIAINSGFLEEYLGDERSSILKDYILRLGENNDLFKIVKNSDFLITTQKEKISLHDLLDRLKGRPIYIDFWASWCGPCRAEFPQINSLMAKYGDKIFFIFISIDNDFYEWKAIVDQEKMFNDKNSFLSLGFTSSSIKSTFNVTTIPRFFFINKEGKVINDNSPRPSDAELISLFNKFK